MFFFLFSYLHYIEWSSKPRINLNICYYSNYLCVVKTKKKTRHFPCCLLLVTFSRLLVTFYSLLITFLSLLVTFCSFLITLCLLFITFCSLFVTFCSLLGTFCWLLVTFYSLLDKKFPRFFFFLVKVNKEVLHINL